MVRIDTGVLIKRDAKMGKRNLVKKEIGIGIKK